VVGVERMREAEAGRCKIGESKGPWRLTILSFTCSGLTG
jgi:hypothetical protein